MLCKLKGSATGVSNNESSVRSMMERMLKRVGLQSSKKVLDTEKQETSESEAGTCSNSEVKDVAADDRKSPDSGELQWCDLLSFRNVCAVGTADSGSGCSAGSIGNQLENDDSVVRRSRRSRVFNFHYLDLHIMEFKPRAITRRLCGGKKPDNELYRSNSFKFERFERIDDAGSLQKQVSLCDEYSLPVDFVNKRRPHSFGAGLQNWTTPSPNGEQVEIVEAYCDPKDSKAYLEPGDEASGKLYTSPDKDYSQPYTTDGSSEAKTPDDEDDGVYEDVGFPEDNPCTPSVEVTGNCVTVIRVGEPEERKQDDQLNKDREEEGEDEEGADEYQLTLHLTAAPPITTTRRNPSPYYYGDLFRDDNEPQQSEVPRRSYSTRQQQHNQIRFYRKSSSLDTPAVGAPCLPKRNSLVSDGTASISSLILSEITPCSSCSGSSHNAASSAGSLLAACLLEWDSLLMPPHRQLRGHQDLPSVCACAGGGQCLDEDDDEVDDVIDYDSRSHHLHHQQYHHHYRQPGQDIRQQYNGGQLQIEEPPVDYDIPEEGEDDYGYDMSGRQRHLYETAFDCKVSRSDDDLDDVDRVTNHPILQMFGSAKVSSSTNTGSSLVRPVRASSSQDPANSVGIFTPKERRKITLVRGKLVKDRPKAIPSRLLQSDTASSTTTLSQDLDGLEIDVQEEEKPEPSPPLPLRGYSPSPPSTAPLPAKFHGSNKDILAMNSIRSAPNLPSGSPAHPRLKDMRLPVKSLRARELPDSRKGSIMEFKGRPRSLVHQEENVPDFKVRPRSMYVEGAGSIIEFKGRPNEVEQEQQPILEFKGRPGREEKVEEPALEFCGRQRGIVSQESGPILEFKGRPTPGNRRCGVRPKYSSTESMATSSSGGSLESIRSSTSEGNRSTTSSESHRSSSLSSHSSDSASSSGGGGSVSGGQPGNTHHLHHYYHHHHHHHHQCSGAGTPLPVGSGGRFFAHQSNKLHILSPISDKSSQEPVSETSDNNRNNNSQKASPEDTDQITSPASTTKVSTTETQPWGETTGIKLKRRTPQNKNIINLTLQQQQSSSSGEAEIQGSDSGISIESRGGTKGNKAYNITGFSFTKQTNNTDNSNNVVGGPADNEQPTADFSDLPFDMPKLRRRRLLQQDNCTSGSATSVDLHDLPFDMPKLRRRLRGQPPLLQQPQTSTESSGVSQASSSQSVRDADRQTPSVPPSRPSLTLNLEAASSPKQRLGLSLNLGGSSFISARGDTIDVQLPLERQGWYHGAITRVEAENVLRLLKEGSYLVRNSESTRQDYSLSLKSARGFMHMRIQQCPETGKFILGQFSKPFDNIPEMIHHYTVNRLPIRGAEHMCLLHPVIEQLL